jgi:dTDP-glucose pyrophosphorylase
MNTKWEDVLIPPTGTIKDALVLINSTALKIAMVVDKSKCLMGVITDGDIRRGLLMNISIEENLTLIMNSSPISADASANKKKLKEIMDSKSILSLPIVSDGVVVGLETLQSIISKPKYRNPVFIMAGGFGTRLRPLTDSCPKPMLKVGDKPMLETTILMFKKAGFDNFYISTHYMPEQIREYFGDGNHLGVDIKYVHESIPLGTGGALGLLPEDIGDKPIIMINGDILTNVNFEKLLEYHIESSAKATMCVREFENQIPYGVINGDGIKVISMVEKPIHRHFVNAGIYVISPEIAKEVEVNRKVDMPTLLEHQISNGEDVVMFLIHEYWLDIGQMDDFNRAQHDIHALSVDL